MSSLEPEIPPSTAYDLEVFIDHEQGRRTVSVVVVLIEAILGLVVCFETGLEPIHEVAGREAQQDLVPRRGDARIACETTPAPFLQEVIPDRAHGPSLPSGHASWNRFESAGEVPSAAAVDA